MKTFLEFMGNNRRRLISALNNVSPLLKSEMEYKLEIHQEDPGPVDYWESWINK